jgi:hypothetical protein
MGGRVLKNLSSISDLSVRTMASMKRLGKCWTSILFILYPSTVPDTQEVIGSIEGIGMKW